MEQFIKTESELSLSISKGKLIVKDTPEKYKNLKLSNFVCIDLLEYTNHIIERRITENISEEFLLLSEFNLTEDGIINYYRFIIPNLEKTLLEESIPESTIVYYNGECYFTNSEISSLYDLENLKKIVFYHLYDFIVSKNLNIIYNKYTFISYELLKKKFLEIQNKYSEKSFYTSKSNIKEESYLRNLILSSILIVKYYISNNLLEEANSILLNLSGSNCLGLKEDNNTLCNCN